MKDERGAFKGTCSILDRSAIAKDMHRWVCNPAYQIVEQPAPVEAAGAKPEAKASVEVVPLPEAAEPTPAN